MDTSKLEREFRRIKSLGYLPSLRNDDHDGAAGNTFESHLGVRENNLKEPDFQGFEIKTKKDYLNSKSPISLFSLKPSYPADGDNYMRSNWGVPDKRYPKVQRFSTSLYAHRWSVVYKTNKFKIDVDRKQKRIYVVKANLDERIIDRTVYWTFDDVREGATKLHNLLLVEADVKKIKGNYYFHYLKATVFLDYIGQNNFIDLVENGFIRYDNRLGVHGPKTSHPGQPHNHGGGFRLDKKNVHLLYRTVKDIS